MSKLSRQILAGALTLIFLSSACAAVTEGTPTPVGTILVEDQTRLPQPTSTAVSVETATGLPVTPIIPITGENVVSMQCQFCVDNETHAVLIIPDFAYFDVVSTAPVGCLTAHVVNGQRILICRGPQLTSFMLNICSDPTNCLQFPVDLQACPLLPAGTDLATSTPFAPVFLTPINTLRPPDSGDDSPQPTGTLLPSLPPTQTPIPGTPTPPPPAGTTEPPPPTQSTDPPPQPTGTEPPAPTDPPTEEPTEPGGNSGQPTRRPSKTPRPTTNID